MAQCLQYKIMIYKNKINIFSPMNFQNKKREVKAFFMHLIEITKCQLRKKMNKLALKI